MTVTCLVCGYYVILLNLHSRQILTCISDDWENEVLKLKKIMEAQSMICVLMDLQHARTRIPDLLNSFGLMAV